MLLLLEPSSSSRTIRFVERGRQLVAATRFSCVQSSQLIKYDFHNQTSEIKNVLLILCEKKKFISIFSIILHIHFPFSGIIHMILYNFVFLGENL